MEVLRIKCLKTPKFYTTGTKLKKKKNLKIVWRRRLMSSVTAKNKRLAIVVKNYANADIKNFWF